MVQVSEHLRVFGFLTRDDFEEPHLAGMVAVYLPQSYNFAGNLVVVPRERVQRLDVAGSEFLAFVVSGGIHELPDANGERVQHPQIPP